MKKIIVALMIASSLVFGVALGGAISTPPSQPAEKQQVTIMK